MSESNQATPAQSSGGTGRGTLAIAIIALLVPLAANNKAGNGGGGSRQNTRFIANDASRLGQQARDFEQKITQLESRIAQIKKR